MAKAGRPKGTKKAPTVPYSRRVRPHWIKILDEVLNELRKKDRG